MLVKLNEEHTLIPPKGTKDYEVFTEFKEETINFIDTIYQKGFLRKTFSKEEEIFLEIFTEQSNAEAKSIFKLEEFLLASNNKAFFKDVEKHGLGLPDLMNIYKVSLAYQLFDIIERFKKYFLAVLDKKSIGLSSNPTLGEIFAKLKHQKINHKFGDVFDVNLRNAIGHFSYYWEKTDFCYIVDPEYRRTRKLTLGELFVIIRKGVLVVNAFNYVAFEQIKKIMNVPTENR